METWPFAVQIEISTVIAQGVWEESGYAFEPEEKTFEEECAHHVWEVMETCACRKRVSASVPLGFFLAAVAET